MAINPYIPLAVNNTPQTPLLDDLAKIQGLKNATVQQAQGTAQLQQTQLQNLQLQRQIDIQKDLDESFKKGFGGGASDGPTPSAPSLDGSTAPAATSPAPTQPPPPTAGMDSGGPSQPPSQLDALAQITKPNPQGSASPAPMPQTQGSPTAPMPQMGAPQPQQPSAPAQPQPTTAIMPNFDRVIQELYRRGRGMEAMSLQKQVAENSKLYTDLRKTQIETAGKTTEIISQVLGGAKDQASWNSGIATLRHLGIDTSQVSPLFDPAQAAQIASQGQTIKDQVDTHGKQLDNYIKAQTAPSTITKAGSEARTAAANATLAEAKANLAKDPASYSAIVDTLGLPPAMASRVKSQVSFYISHGQVDEANKALDKSIEDANAPGKAAAVKAAETPAIVAQERQLAPIRTQTAVNTEIAKAKLAPGYVAEIQNPAMQSKAINDWTAANNEYQGKVGDAQRLLNFVQAARSGNQTAGSMIPIAEVREIVNRLNTQELSAAGGGSVGRRVSNWVSTATEGKPSDGALRDAEDFARLGLNAAKTTYGGKIAGLNALGAKFPNEPPAAPGAAPQPAGYTVGQPITIKGKPMKITKIYGDGTFDAQ